MSDSITRFECPECGRSLDYECSHARAARNPPPYGERAACPGVPVERTYVAVDALLTDETLEAVCHAGHDAYEERSRIQGHVTGSPVPWDDVPEPYRSATIAGYAAGLSAAIAAVTGEQT